MSAKKLIFLGTFLAVLLVVSSESESHTLHLGDKVIGERLLLQQSVEKSYALARRKEKDITFNTPNAAKITRIEALDRVGEDHGAYVTLVAGGVGHDFVTLNFKSQLSRGIHYLVSLYGR